MYPFADPLKKEFPLTSDIKVLIAWDFINSTAGKKVFSEDEAKKFKARVILASKRYGLSLEYKPEEVDANIIKELTDKKEIFDKVMANINTYWDLANQVIRNPEMSNKKEVIVALTEQLKNAILDLESF